jgi:hypothetical protein
VFSVAGQRRAQLALHIDVGVIRDVEAHLDDAAARSRLRILWSRFGSVCGAHRRGLVQCKSNTGAALERSLRPQRSAQSASSMRGLRPHARVRFVRVTFGVTATERRRTARAPIGAPWPVCEQSVA